MHGNMHVQMKWPAIGACHAPRRALRHAPAQADGSPVAYALTWASDSVSSRPWYARRKGSHGSRKYRLMAGFPRLYGPRNAGAERGFVWHTFRREEGLYTPQVKDPRGSLVLYPARCPPCEHGIRQPP